MNIAATVTCLMALASFGWGMLRFFTKPSGLTWPAAAVGLLGLLFGVCQVVALATASTPPWRLLLALMVHGLSLLIFWSAIRACGWRGLTAIFEADTPTRLVRRGPYRYVRHPFYASYAIFWLAGWVGSGSTVTLVSAAVMLAFYLDGARREERKFSRSPLAAEYAAYRQHVGLLVPKIARGQSN